MTKAEELKVLDKIEALIKSAGDDSYIEMTFKGIVDIARGNIENDFGNSPVEDLETMRKNFHKMDEIAKSAFADLDSLREDFDELAGAYREAVGVCRVASYYIHGEKNRLLNVVDNLPDDADDGQIGAAVRAHKQAKEAGRRCGEVLDKALRQPFCFAMKNE